MMRERVERFHIVTSTRSAQSVITYRGYTIPIFHDQHSLLRLSCIGSRAKVIWQFRLCRLVASFRAILLPSLSLCRVRNPTTLEMLVLHRIWPVSLFYVCTT